MTCLVIRLTDTSLDDLPLTERLKAFALRLSEGVQSTCGAEVLTIDNVDAGSVHSWSEMTEEQKAAWENWRVNALKALGWNDPNDPALPLPHRRRDW